MNKKPIYMDYAATTFVRKEVMRAMLPYFSEKFGNPSSFNSPGLVAKKALGSARATVAKTLGAQPEEIVFTGSGTESINLAIKGVARANRGVGKHIITSKIEHHAVLETCEYLEKNEGFDVTYLDVDRYGLVGPKDVARAIRKDTVLITIMYANNEIGTAQPIAEIGEIAKRRGVYFHTDACQAGGALDLDTKRLNVDLLTLNGSKIYGPKGVGMLYIRKGVKILPIIHGGGQEFGVRSGTENVPAIVGFAKALELAQREAASESKRLTAMRDKMARELLKRIPKSFLNGHPTRRLPNNVNISILDVEGEAILLHLDDEGIYASTGSACASSSLEPSHVITATGLPYEAAHGSIRFSLGKTTTMADVDRVINTLPGIVKKLRELSPIRLSPKDIRTR